MRTSATDCPRLPFAAVIALLVCGFVTGCLDYQAAPAASPTASQAPPTSRPAKSSLPGPLPYSRESHPEERHLANIRQLTDGGENAEAYFSSDGKRLIFQSKRPPYQCDQIFTIGIDGAGLKLVSTGTGRTTCSYFLYPEDRQIIFSSTHAAAANCPPEPDRSLGYVWPIYESYDIYIAAVDGSDLRPLARSPGYDAEATLAPDGSRIVFTSTRDGDLDIYSMKPDGSDVRRLTSTPGYDGGPFYSPDGKKIVYRARHPEGEELADYQRLLEQGLIRPSKLDVYMMDADGSNVVALTDNSSANFCPFFHPDGKRVIFSSNVGDEQRREFDLYSVKIDGTGLERITYTEEFDGFPMFSPDGKTIVWCSNRHNREFGETNVFIADWVE